MAPTFSRVFARRNPAAPESSRFAGYNNTVGMGAIGYRDGSVALEQRRAEHRARSRELDDQCSQSARRQLPRKLRRELERLRAAAEPAGESMQELMAAEEALDAYEHKLDEALGLAAELRRSVEPFVRPDALMRWVGFTTLSVALLSMTVQQAGLGDFMLSAVGVKVLRATAMIPASRLAYEADSHADIVPAELECAVSAGMLRCTTVHPHRRTAGSRSVDTSFPMVTR